MNAAFLIILLLAGAANAAGPIYKHEDEKIQREFVEVYKELRNTTNLNHDQRETRVGKLGDGTTYYLSINAQNATPVLADCDEDNERGKLVLDYLNNRLYVCNGAARGWDFVALTN